jgi:uncharacterized damage-inducible protein DinB
MISYLKRMFPYEEWANQQVIETLTENDQTSLNLMMHIQAAKHIWLTRLTGEKRELKGFPEGDLESIKTWNNRNNTEFASWLSKQDESTIEESFESMNVKRERYSLKISDLMIQLMNHFTYHRAQIAKNIVASGNQPNATDYLVYIQLVGNQ